MAEDSIDVKLGASDDGLRAGLEGAAKQTESSTQEMSAAFMQMAQAIQASMEKMSEGVAGAMEKTNRAVKEQKAEVEGMPTVWGRIGESLAQTKEHMEGFAESLNKIHQLMGLFAEVAGLGFIGEQVADLAKEFGEYGEQTENAAKKTGLTTDAVQQLGFAAKMSGVSSDGMSVAMMRLSRGMSEAQGGSKQIQAAFNAVGISANQLKGMSVDQVMEKIADKFAASEDGANKAAIAMQLFGRQGAELIPMLDKGAKGIDELRDKASQLGLVMSGEDIEAAGQLNDRMKEMSAQASMLKLRIGGELAPTFEVLTQNMLESYTQGGALKTVMEAIEITAQSVGVVVNTLAGTFEEFTTRINGAAQSLIQWAQNAATAAAMQGGLTAKEAGGFDTTDHSKETDDKLRKQFEAEQRRNLEILNPQDYVPGAYQDQSDRQQASEDAASQRAKGKLPPISDGGQPGDHMADAERALQEAQNAASLALTKEKIDEEKSLYADRYANGLMSAQQYYAKLLDIQKAELEAERKNKEDDLKAAQNATATDSKQVKNGDRSKVIEDLAKESTLKGEIAVLDQKLANVGPENARQEADAVRKLNEELALTDISKQQNIGKSLAEAAKNEAELRYNTGQISKQQLTALEQQLQNDLYQIDMAALQQKLALYSQDTYHNPQKIAETNAQIEQLEAQHQAQMTQLASQAAQEQMADTKQATDDLEQGFEKAFTSFADGTKTAKQAFVEFLTSIEQQLTQLVSKDLFNKLFNMQMGGSGMSVNSSLQGMFGKLFGGGAQDTAETANTTALATLTTAIAQLTATLQYSGTNGGANGLSSLLGSVVGGGGDFAGDFGFTATGITGSADAVASGAMSSGTSGMSALMGLASFDVGSPYIPTDMVAQIHQGEAIIPAHLNSPYAAGNTAVTNNFNLPGGTDLRTQSQIAGMAGGAIRRAMQRNG